MDDTFIIRLQAVTRGYLLRRSLVHNVRREYMMIVKELEPDMHDGMVIWRRVLSFPLFKTSSPELEVNLLKENMGVVLKQSKQRKCHKRKKDIKISSTQTEIQQTQNLHPGVRYTDISPGKELFDSFSSLSSVNCTIEQHSPQQQTAPPPICNEQLATDAINSLTLQTTKKHLMGSQHIRDRKHKHKNVKSRSARDVNSTTTFKDVSIPTATTLTVGDDHVMSTSTPLVAPTRPVTHATSMAELRQYLTSTVPTPSPSDVSTTHHHPDGQSHVMERVKHWSKFEQLKAKYLPQAVAMNNQKTFHTRILVKQNRKLEKRKQGNDDY